MKKLTKKELVMIDERFIEWLYQSGKYDSLKGKRYLEIFVTDDLECDLIEHDSLDELKESFGEEGAWELEAIFDLKEGEEVYFETVNEINFKK